MTKEKSVSDEMLRWWNDSPDGDLTVDLFIEKVVKLEAELASWKERAAVFVNKIHEDSFNFQNTQEYIVIKHSDFDKLMDMLSEKKEEGQK